MISTPCLPLILLVLCGQLSEKRELSRAQPFGSLGPRLATAWEQGSA